MKPRTHKNSQTNEDSVNDKYWDSTNNTTTLLTTKYNTQRNTKNIRV